MNKDQFRNMSPKEFLDWLYSKIENKGEIDGRVVNIQKLIQFKRACELLKQLIPEKVTIDPPSHKERHAMAYADVYALDISTEQEKSTFLELWKAFDQISFIPIAEDTIRISLCVTDVWSE